MRRFKGFDRISQIQSAEAKSQVSTIGVGSHRYSLVGKWYGGINLEGTLVLVLTTITTFT